VGQHGIIKKKRKERCLMKKMLIVLLAIAIATPAMAAVTVSGTDQGSLVGKVSYNWDGAGKRPRAFALTVSVSAGTITTCTPTKTGESTAASKGFGIFPGTIAIDSTGAVTSYGTPVEANTRPGAGGTGLGTSSIVIAMGSLYTAGDANKAPANSGDLFTFAVTSACTVTVTPEVTYRAGVVGEDANGITVAPITFALTAGTPECMKSTATEYAAWVQWNKPNCWCFARHCRGDINNTKQGSYWVYTNDLTGMKAAYGKTDTQLQAITNGICSDINHTKQGSYRVYTNDLSLLKSWYGKTEAQGVAVCDMTNYNFWTTGF
jgi:hypothetical protein